MNLMQKIAVAAGLLVVAALLAIASQAEPGSGSARTPLVLAVAASAACGLLVAVFARGSVVGRLQKGSAVISVVAAGTTLARAEWFVPYGEVAVWPSALAVAGCELLVGGAVVVLLSLLRRKPACGE
jgi:hypothetical protein